MSSSASASSAIDSNRLRYEWNTSLGRHNSTSVCVAPESRVYLGRNVLDPVCLLCTGYRDISARRAI